MIRIEMARPWLEGEPDGPASKGAFVVWKSECHRSAMTASCLGAPLWLISPFRGRGVLRNIARYIASFFVTVSMLYWHRPTIVIMLNQPLFLVLSTSLYCFPMRVPFVLDCHSNAYSATKRKLWHAIYMYFSKTALFNINHNRSDQDVVRAGGGRSWLIPEIPGHIDVRETVAGGLISPSLLVVCSYMKDEPIEAIIDVAATRPNVQFYLTGDYRKADAALIARRTSNVHLLGYISRDQYLAHAASVGAIVTLSRRSHIMQMAAEEALCLGVPLLTNRSEVLEEVFADAAVFVDIQVDQIATGIDVVLGENDAFRSKMIERRGERRKNLRDLLQRMRDSMFLKAS